MAKYMHKIAVIDINKVVPNVYNPNIMEDKIFKQTKKNIEKEGLIGAIICRENPNKQGEYVIIDGEHRWKASKELGYTEIPIIILDKKLPEAMISTINFNKLKGELDSLKLAEVIHQLNKTYTIEELEEKLGYTKDEMEGLQNLLKFDFDQFEDNVKLPSEEPEEYEFKVMLTAKQNKIIETAIDETGKENISEALVVICLEYLKNAKKDKS